MSFKTASVVLASAVAANGTFTVNYPSNTTAGDYAGYGHSAYARGLQSNFSQDAGQLSLSFGASNITVTYKGSTSIPAGSTVTMQLNMRGTDDGRAVRAMQDNKRTSFVTPVRVDLGAPAAAASNNIATSQSVAAAASFALNGSLVSGGIATLDVPRNVVAAWTTTSVLTITGKDEYGNTIVEQSASGTSHTGKKAFKTITSISSSASITSATVGTGDVLGLPIFVEKASQILQEVKDAAILPRKAGVVELTSRILMTDGTYGVVHSSVAGTIKEIRTVEVEGGVTTNDAVLTFKIGTTAITTGVVTVATSGSAAGVKDSATPTAANAVVVGDAINVTVSGTPGAGKTVIATIVIELDESQQLDGTFVAGVQTTPTATTGDVRGTYDPALACDGSRAFSLVVMSPDPTYRGVDQYDG